MNISKLWDRRLLPSLNMASNLFFQALLIELCKDIQKKAIDGFPPVI